MSTLSLFYAPFRSHPMLCLCVCVCVCKLSRPLVPLPRDSLLVILSVLVCVCVFLPFAAHSARSHSRSSAKRRKENGEEGECVRQELVTAGGKAVLKAA